MIGIFLDSETSGLNPLKHALLEIAYKMVDVETGLLLHTYSAVVAQDKETWKRADPGSLQVNGFTWKKVSRGSSKEDVAKDILASFDRLGVKHGKAVFICQNPSFDRAFFSQLIDPDVQEAKDWPYHWLDLASMYWALQMGREPTPWQTGVSKDKISEVYNLPPETKPHKAMNGVDHLLACYEALVGFPAKAEMKNL